jgi:hypothetical protein
MKKEVIGYNHPEAVQNRAAIQAEINKNKVNIDFACFCKTPNEKEALRTAKHLYRKHQRG